MKSVFEIEVNVPQEKLAELFAEPENYKKWMGDLEGFEILYVANRECLDRNIDLCKKMEIRRLTLLLL